MVRLASGLLVGLLIATSAVARPPVHIIKTDLEALIRAAAESPTQFAVNVPESVSTTTAGSWTVANHQATWHYAARVPSAVSLSFHATRAMFPASATLTVRGVSTTTIYRARDVHRSELWSRVHPGDALEFTLTVAAADRSRVILEIRSFQAGYRSIGAGVSDHPIYRRLSAKKSGNGNASCVQNYECSVTAANTPTSQATVGLTIGNMWQCSGTLINDVAGDNAPYILTARHCETGKLGGGNPGAASTVTVYWDAKTACGAALGSLYDPGIPTQTGATTVVEQQDAWLIELDTNPVVSDSQFAGFDATGGTVQGGYTVHHALGYDDQLTTWFGQADAVQLSGVLGVTYLSDFWETVNQTGNVGPGASGSGLFDQNDHLVGSLSLGRQDADSSGYESCPVANPIAPNGANGAADFTSLAAVWTATADTTSSTGTATLKSVLDPANTGTEVVASVPSTNVSFTAGMDSLSFGLEDPLTWNAPSATSCTASGGMPGDGWSGSLASAGNQSVTETTAGDVTYTLTCAFPGGKSVRRSLTITWEGPIPVVTLAANKRTVWTTRPAVLTWTSNVSPCAITGGSLSLTNLSSSGSTSTTQATSGDVTYQLTCGSAPNTAQTTATVSYVTPSLLFAPNSSDRLVGEPLLLEWRTAADSCTPSGGAPNDGWSTAEFLNQDPQNPAPPFAPHVTALGTYTYSLTCSSGPISVQQSFAVTIENNAPYTSASVDHSSVVFSNGPSDYFTVSWTSNLTGCDWTFTPSFNGQIVSVNPIADGFMPQQSATLAPSAPGVYTWTQTCTTALPPTISATSPPITITVLPASSATATLSVSPQTVTVGQSFMINWLANPVSGCSASGGGAFTTPFVGTLAPSGTESDSSSSVGTYTLSISCPNTDPNQGPGTAQATLTVTAATAPPTATLTASPASLTNGQTITLTWSSTNATGCTASGGGANGSPWTGSLATSGTVQQAASTNGTFTYTVTCSAGTQSAQSQATVTVSAPSSGGGSSGGGGGGALGVLELGSLAVIWSLRRRTRHSRVDLSPARAGTAAP